MSEQPPLKQKGLGIHRWAALLCLLAVPVADVVHRTCLMALYMFPDVSRSHPLIKGIDWIQAHAPVYFAMAGIVSGLFALSGLRRGGRVWICWMVCVGLILAALVLAGALRH